MLSMGGNQIETLPIYAKPKIQDFKNPFNRNLSNLF